ncbi:hypothetical protein F5Y19DRAFT_412549 [Xylariaceae sp. FL1651]|nr:hypothetical protein F5Y19DRAFT_412549 [Xylariaceae sp. FL1651]
MYFSTLSLLAFASGAALAKPTSQHGSRAATLPLPYRTIFQLSDTIPGSWFENIAIRENGDLLVTMLSPYADTYLIQQPFSSSPNASIISKIKGANGSIGITEVKPDTFAISAGTFSALAVPVPGTMGVWELSLAGPKPTTRLIASMPEAGFLNGATSISDGFSYAVLVADGQLGVVWRVDLTTGKYEIAVNVPEMAPVSGSAIIIGVNGVKVHDGYLYWSNSNMVSIFRIAINKKGFPVEGAAVELIAYFDGDNIDDFDIDANGAFWVATNDGDTVVVAKKNSTEVVVLGSSTELTVAGDTALAFGQTKSDKDIVYVVTGGAQLRPVNGTLTEPAKIIAINRAGFK